MSGHRVRVRVLLLGVVAVISACSSTGETVQREQRQQAVNRWTQCIERYSANYRGPANLISRRARNHCEGYQRDILAVYPQHLQNQIQSLLSQRAETITTARVMKTGHREYLEAFEGSRLDTLKKRLR